MLSLESSNSIAWCGISNTIIGTLKPGVSIDIPLCLIPLRSGIIVSILYKHYNDVTLRCALRKVVHFVCLMKTSTFHYFHQ